MRKYIPYVCIFVIGAAIGMLLCRRYHVKRNFEEVQRDTVVRYDTVRYSRIDLSSKTQKLNVPKVSTSEFVIMPEKSVSIVYRDSIRYVTLPRQHYFTETGDVQIWHSGIDSRIDSLNVMRQTQQITETVRIKEKKNHLSLGIEANYLQGISVPVKIQYTRDITRHFAVYGYAERDLALRQWGVGIGTKVSIGF